jgi:hypothetical protein
MSSPSRGTPGFDRRVREILGSVARRDTVLGRFYDVDGESLPSVTFILSCIAKPALVKWAANQERTLVMEAAADLYADVARLTTPLSRTAYLTTLEKRIGKLRAHQRQVARATEIGSQVHRLIEWWLRRELGQAVGPEPAVVDDAQWAFMAWQDWAKAAKLRPIFIEQIVFSLVHGYAGTADLLAEVNGEVRLIDFKTSRAIYPEAHLQNAAYQVALSEMGHGAPVGGLIVRLPRVQSDPQFEVAMVPPSSELFPVFLAIKQVWEWWYAKELEGRARPVQRGEDEAKETGACQRK